MLASRAPVLATIDTPALLATAMQIRRLLILDAHVLEPSGRRLHVAEDLGRRTDTFGQNRVHPRHPVRDVIGCDNGSRPEVYQAEHVRRTSNEPTDLVRGDIRRGATSINQLGTSEIPVRCSRSKCALMSWNVTMPSA